MVTLTESKRPGLKAIAAVLSFIAAFILAAPAAHALVDIMVPEIGIKFTLYGVDGRPPPLRESSQAYFINVIVHDTLYTIERYKRAPPQPLAELWPEFESRHTQHLARSGFRVEGTEQGAIGGHPAQLLKAKRDRTAEMKAHWQMIAVTQVNGHFYVFTLYSTERTPWKNKRAMNVLEDMQFISVGEAAEDRGDDE